MSNTLNWMLENKKGYRTEKFSGSSVRDIEDIIRFEISMGNTDIVSHMRDNFNILEDYDEKDCENWNEFSFLCQENAVNITDEIVKFLILRLGVSSKKELSGLWLTNYKEVMLIYNCKKDNIHEYLLPNDNLFVVISDLDMDGSLFVFRNIFKNIKEN